MTFQDPLPQGPVFEQDDDLIDTGFVEHVGEMFTRSGGLFSQPGFVHQPGIKEGAEYRKAAGQKAVGETLDVMTTDLFNNATELGRQLANAGLRDVDSLLGTSSPKFMQDLIEATSTPVKPFADLSTSVDAFGEVVKSVTSGEKGLIDAMTSPDVYQRAEQKKVAQQQRIIEYEAGKPGVQFVRETMDGLFHTLGWIGGAPGKFVHLVSGLTRKGATQLVGRSLMVNARAAGMTSTEIAAGIQQGTLMRTVIGRMSSKPAFQAVALREVERWGIPWLSMGAGLGAERLVNLSNEELQAGEDHELSEKELLAKRLGMASHTAVLSLGYVALGKVANAIEGVRFDPITGEMAAPGGVQPAVKTMLGWLGGKEKWTPHVAGTVGGFMEGLGFSLTDVNFYKEFLPALYQGDMETVSKHTSHMLSSGLAFGLLRGRNPGSMMFWRRMDPEGHKAPREALGPQAEKQGRTEPDQGGPGVREAIDPVLQKAVDGVHQSGWTYQETRDGWASFELPGYEGRLWVQAEGKEPAVRVEASLLGHLLGTEVTKIGGDQVAKGADAADFLRSLALTTNISEIEGRIDFHSRGFKQDHDGTWLTPDLGSKVANRFGTVVEKNNTVEGSRWEKMKGGFEPKTEAMDPRDPRSQVLNSYVEWMTTIERTGVNEVSPEAMEAIKSSLELVAFGDRNDPAQKETLGVLLDPTFQQVAMRLENVSQVEFVAFHLSLVAAGRSNADYAVEQIVREVPGLISSGGVKEPGRVSEEASGKKGLEEGPYGENLPEKRPVDVEPGAGDQGSKVEGVPGEGKGGREGLPGGAQEDAQGAVPEALSARQPAALDYTPEGRAGEVYQQGIAELSRLQEEAKTGSEIKKRGLRKRMKEVKRSLEALKQGRDPDLVEIESASRESLNDMVRELNAEEAAAMGKKRASLIPGFGKMPRAELEQKIFELKRQRAEREKQKEAEAKAEEAEGVARESDAARALEVFRGIKDSDYEKMTEAEVREVMDRADPSYVMDNLYDVKDQEVAEGLGREMLRFEHFLDKKMEGVNFEGTKSEYELLLEKEAGAKKKPEKKGPAKQTSIAGTAEEKQKTLGEESIERLGDEFAETKAKLQLTNEQTVITTPAGKKLKGVYVVAEAKDVRQSHDPKTNKPIKDYPAELQPRDRERTGEQTARMAKELDPTRLGDSSDTSSGAPIVGRDLVVESGNARTMAIKRAYAEGGEAAQRYRDWVKERFGIEGKEPIVVKMRADKMTGKERVEFAHEAGESVTARMSKVEQAKVDSRLIDEKMMVKFNPGENGSLLVDKNMGFMSEFVSKLPKSERDSMFEKGTGEFTVDALERVEAAVIQAAYDNYSFSQRLLEGAETHYKNILNAFKDNAAYALKIRKNQELGKFDKDYPVVESMTEAFLFMDEMRRNDRNVDAEIATPALPGFAEAGVVKDFTPESRAIATVFNAGKRSKKFLVEFQKNMLRAVEEMGNPDQGKLFGGEDAPTFKEITIAASRAALERAPSEAVADALKRSLYPAEGDSKAGHMDASGRKEGVAENIDQSLLFKDNRKEKGEANPLLILEMGASGAWFVTKWSAKTALRAVWETGRLGFYLANKPYQALQYAMSYIMRPAQPVLNLLDTALSQTLTKPVMNTIGYYLDRLNDMSLTFSNRLAKHAYETLVNEKAPEWKVNAAKLETTVAWLLESFRYNFAGTDLRMEEVNTERDRITQEMQHAVNEIAMQLRTTYGSNDIGVNIEKAPLLKDFVDAMENGRRPKSVEEVKNIDTMSLTPEQRDRLDQQNAQIQESYKMSRRMLARAAQLAVENGLLKAESVLENYYPHLRGKVKKGSEAQEVLDNLFTKNDTEGVAQAGWDLVAESGKKLREAAEKREDWRMKQTSSTPAAKGAKAIKRARGRWMKRTREEIDAENYLLDPRIAIPMVLRQEMMAAAWKRWMDDVAASPDLSMSATKTKKTKEGDVEVTVTPEEVMDKFGYQKNAFRYLDPEKYKPSKYGKLSGKYVHREVYHLLERAINSRSDFAEISRMAASMMKKAQVTQNPFSVVRQDISQPQMLASIGVPGHIWTPENKRRAEFEIKSLGKTYKELVDFGEMGVEFAMADEPALAQEAYKILIDPTSTRSNTYQLAAKLYQAAMKVSVNKVGRMLEDKFILADQQGKILAYEYIKDHWKDFITEGEIKESFRIWKAIHKRGWKPKRAPWQSKHIGEGGVVPDGIRNNDYGQFKRWAIKNEARQRIRSAWNYKAMVPIFDNLPLFLWYQRFNGKLIEASSKYGLKEHPTSSILYGAIPFAIITGAFRMLFGETEDDRRRMNQIAGQGPLSPVFNPFMMPVGRGDDGVMNYMNLSSYSVHDGLLKASGLAEGPYDIPSSLTGNPLIERGVQAWKGSGEGGRIYDKTDPLPKKWVASALYMMQGLFPEVSGIPSAIDFAREGLGMPGDLTKRTKKRIEHMTLPGAVYDTERTTRVLKSRAREEESMQFEKGGLRDEFELRREMTEEMSGKSDEEKKKIALDYVKKFQAAGFQAPTKRTLQMAVKWSTFRPAARSLMYERASVQIERIVEMIDRDELTATDARQILAVLPGKKAIQGALYDLASKYGTPEAAAMEVRRVFLSLRKKAGKKKTVGSR